MRFFETDRLRLWAASRSTANARSSRHGWLSIRRPGTHIRGECSGAGRLPSGSTSGSTASGYVSSSVTSRCSTVRNALRQMPSRTSTLGGGQDQEQLLGFFRRHNEEFGRMVGINRSKATYYKYRCVCNHLESYIRIRYGRNDLEFGELDREFLYGFHRHISGACGCSKNTIWIYMIALKHILAQARNRGYLKTDLFAGYKIRSERVSRSYLSVEEIRRLIRLDLPDRTPATDQGLVPVRLLHRALLCGYPATYPAEHPVPGSADLDLHEPLQNRFGSQCAPVSGSRSDPFALFAVPERRPDFRPAHERMVQCLPASHPAAGGYHAPRYVPLRSTHLRHYHHAVTGRGDRDNLQTARTQKYTHHADLCDTYPCKTGE